MASSWTHAIGAVAVASLLLPRAALPRVWLAVAVAAIIPDIDAIGRPIGRGDLSWLGGHRALTHSLTFAVVAGLLLLATLRLSTRNRRERLLPRLAFALAIALHGALDSLTTYGEGIAFLAPWSERRYWAPWRLLGEGIVRDTVAFVLMWMLARLVMIKRGLPLPGALRIFDSTAWHVCAQTRSSVRNHCWQFQAPLGIFERFRATRITSRATSVSHWSPHQSFAASVHRPNR